MTTTQTRTADRPNRRTVLGAGAGGLALVAAPAAAFAQTRAAFPPGFLWGAATASYQVEGGVHDGGRKPSIWDTFSHIPGKVKDDDTGDVADDSYHKWPQDLALAKGIGLTSYRFSIAWPRVQPDGSGPINEAGLDYYDRLVDGMLKAGLRPLPTLYHWDLPQKLQDQGGWPNRDVAYRLADYSQAVARRLGDRVRDWAVLNEVKTFTQAGYLDGIHAPGIRDPYAFLKATHTANLSVGLVYRALKAVNPALNVGGAYDCAPCWPATDTQADRAAAARWDAMINLWYLQTTLTGQYPSILPPDRQAELLGFRPGDEQILKAPLDFVGINYYSGWKVSNQPGGKGIPGLNVAAEWGYSPRSIGVAANGWDIDPKGFYDILKRMQKVTGTIPIEITENGTADNTGPGADGHIHDIRRIQFHQEHLSELRRAIADGVPVRAYHLWSLLDNFEWAEGYTQRFGIVYVDFLNDQKRTPKDSAAWYARVIRANAVV